MPQLKTFISQDFRPDVFGGSLDKKHKSQFRLTKTRGVNAYPRLKLSAICFGPKKDNVLINLEHILKKNDKVLIFYYEDLHLRWSYVDTGDESYFLYKKNEDEEYIIEPKYLYMRGCYVHPSDNYWTWLGNFFNFIELWGDRVLCSPRKQMPNESKLYQLNNSLKKSAQNRPSISIGKSYVIKGKNRFNCLRQDQAFIVKSLSGVRSVVVDQKSYSQWNFNHLNKIPVLFQEKVEGNDLRIHIIDKKIFAKKSLSKENVDYRYDKNFFKLADVDVLDQELKNFCISVAVEENNQLLGLDFIHTKAGYCVLEANPSPGWSAYHPYNGIDAEPFITELLSVLKGA